MSCEDDPSISCVWIICPSAATCETGVPAEVVVGVVEEVTGVIEEVVVGELEGDVVAGEQVTGMEAFDLARMELLFKDIISAYSARRDEVMH